MNDPIREAFERISAPAFGREFEYRKKSNGEYENGALEDHWQTFQEGWEAAIEDVSNAVLNVRKNFERPGCIICGDKLMSDMTQTCYSCNQKV